MIKMQTIKSIVKRVLAPVTIMFIPHHNASKSLHLRIPVVVVFFSIILGCLCMVYLSVATIDIIKYRKMDREIREYSIKISDFNVTMASLKKAEKDLYKLLSLGSREKVLENVEVADMGTRDMGAIDIKQIQQQIALSKQTISSIQDYLQAERDTYVAMPTGWPVTGRITSPFGRRVNPISGRG
jgi:murein DD-endopeptidase MepM/ murein hydrolase activator NlpD